MNIGTLYALVVGDATKLLPSIQGDIEKAGDAAGKSMGQKMVGQLKSNTGMAIRAIGGALATLETGRLLQLDKAMADFRKETGATKTEAKEAGKAINDLSGKNLQGIEEIGAAMAKVRTDLGVKDPLKLKEITQQFLTLAHVTGRDAADEVKAFDDILDAWGLTAEDALGIMDKLVAAHQKYGGSIAEDEAALAKFAPAMKALNFDIDDTIALLNLFKTKGLDAAETQRAFNTAVKNLPPGTNLKTVLDGLSKIEDPARRAGEAIRIFGSRGGVALSNALAPGVGALDDYRQSAAETSGALFKASDDAKSAVDKIRLLVKGFSAALGELGLTDLGPLIIGLTTLASLGGGKFVTLLLAPFKGLGKLLIPLIQDALFSAIIPAQASAGLIGDAAAASTAGSMTSLQSIARYRIAGTTAGEAFGVAFKLAAIFGIALAGREIGELAQAGAEDFTARVKQKYGDAGQSVADAARITAQKVAAHLADIGQDFYDLGDRVVDVEKQFATHLTDMGDDAKDLRDRLKVFTRSMSALFGDLVQSMADDAQAMIDQYFDPIQTHADILNDRQALHAAEEAHRNAKTKADARSAANDIVNALDDQASHLVDLGKQGKLTGKDVDKFKTDTAAAYKELGRKVPPEIKKIIDKLDDLATYEGSAIKVDIHASYGAANQTKRAQAAGGTNRRGQRSWVGEKGPELVEWGEPNRVFPTDESRKMVADESRDEPTPGIPSSMTASAAAAPPPPSRVPAPAPSPAPRLSVTGILDDFAAFARSLIPSPLAGVGVPALATAGGGGDTYHDEFHVHVGSGDQRDLADAQWEMRRLAVKRSMAPRVGQRPKTRTRG